MSTAYTQDLQEKSKVNINKQDLYDTTQLPTK